MHEPAHILYDPTVEFVEVEVTSTDGTVLDTQPVAFSLDRTNWQAAEWAGDPGTTRTARLLMGPATDLPLPERGRRAALFVRLTDTPEAPVMNAGYLAVR